MTNENTETTGAVEAAAEAIREHFDPTGTERGDVFALAEYETAALTALAAALDETELAAVVRGALQLTESQQMTSAARDAYVAHAVRMHVIGGAA